MLPPATISSQSVSYLPTQPELAGAMTSQTKSHVERWAALGATTPQVSFAELAIAQAQAEEEMHSNIWTLKVSIDLCPIGIPMLEWFQELKCKRVNSIGLALTPRLSSVPIHYRFLCNQNTQKLRIPKSKCVTSIYMLAVHQAAAHQTSRTASSVPGGGQARGCGSSSAPPPSPSSCPASAAQTQAASPRKTRPALCKPS